MNAQHPVAAAVAPLKEAAVQYAVEEAQKVVVKVKALYEAGGWNLDVVAPRGNSLRDSKQVYREKMAKHAFFSQFAKPASHSRSMKDPDMRVWSEEGVARFLKIAEENAGLDFDAYVAKLVGKVGEGVEEASVVGRYLWLGSVLSVRKAGGEVERWSTKQIVNFSVYGKAFNQWPSRKVK